MSEVSPVNPSIVFTKNGEWRLYEIAAHEQFRQLGSAGNACLTGICKDPVFPGEFATLKNADGTPNAAHTK